MFVKVGIDTWRGVDGVHRHAICRARSPASTTFTCSADLADASTEATQAIGAYVEELENEVRPKAKASFRLGRERFEQKLRLEEGIALPVDRLLAIAERELRQDAGRIPHAGRPPQRRRSDRGVAQGEAARIPAPGHADRDRARAARRAADVPRRATAIVDCPRAASVRRGADAGVFPLVVGQHVDAGAVRIAAVARDVLPDRRRSDVVRRSADRAPARFQHPDAVEHLDPRGVPRPLPPLPAPAQGGVEGPPLDDVRAGVVHGRLGALLRADDDRGRLRPRAITR